MHQRGSGHPRGPGAAGRNLMARLSPGMSTPDKPSPGRPRGAIEDLNVTFTGGATRCRPSAA
jgi:hypothetical protein